MPKMASCESHIYPVIIVTTLSLLCFTAIAPMIQSARAAITNTGNQQAQAEFSEKSDNVSNVSSECSIRVLHQIMCIYFINCHPTRDL